MDNPEENVGKEIINAKESAPKTSENETNKLMTDYDKWNSVKKHLALHGRQPNAAQGEIWWAGVGLNLGSEMNGKNTRFARPVLIYKKLSRYNYMAIPLSSKPHEGSWYVQFNQGNVAETALIGQARVMSVRRLYSRMGEIDEADLKRVEEAFIKLYSL